jgi:hypothetical protein
MDLFSDICEDQTQIDEKKKKKKKKEVPQD